MSEQTTKPAVISISSHVTSGSVGNRSTVFALETLGFPVWAVPTVTLPWHPGHGPATRMVPGNVEFDAFIDDIAGAPGVIEVKGIITGYMANPEQVNAVARLVSELKEKDPSLLYACDPVIGDEAGLYVAEQTALAIRDKLIPLCDILTPNRFELGWICDSDVPATWDQTKSLGRSLGIPSVLVTSVPGNFENEISNLLLVGDETLLANHRKLADPPNGTGDLTAALIFANQLSGLVPRDNLQRSTASVLEILELTARSGSKELVLAGNGASLLCPKTEVRILEL